MRHAFKRLSGVLGSAAAVPTFAVFAQQTALAQQQHQSKLSATASQQSLAPFALSTTSYSANELLEDRHDYKVINGRLYAAVMDGHGGWQAAEYARRHLLDAVHTEISAHAANAQDAAQVSQALMRAFMRVDRGFLSSIRPAFELGFGDVAHVGCCALVALTLHAPHHTSGGTSAHASMLPTHVVVANAGDCRAVLGRYLPPNGPSPPPSSSPPSALSSSPSASSSGAATALQAGSGSPGAAAGSGADSDEEGPSSQGSYTPYAPPSSPWRPLPLPESAATMSAGERGWVQAVGLSLDHNAREPRERQRLGREHPGEADIVVCKPGNPSACYVKGRLQPTRALGDAYLKVSEFNGPPPTPAASSSTGAAPGGPGAPLVSARAWGRHIRPPYTPPYVTSLPEVHVQALDMGRAGQGGLDDNSFLIMGKCTPHAAPAPSPPPPSCVAHCSHSLSLLCPPSCPVLPSAACDGVWDMLSNEEAVSFVVADCLAPGAPHGEDRGGVEHGQAGRASVAERLKDYVLRKTAEEEGMDEKWIRSLPPGKQGRRAVHDDITCVVVWLGAAHVRREAERAGVLPAQGGAGGKRGWFS